MIVNIFLQSSAMTFVISALGRGHLHRPDRLRHPKIRTFGETPARTTATAIRRGALLGALTSTSTSSTCFLMLLRLMGDRR